MSNDAVDVRGLGKRYRLGQRETYSALRDVIASAVRSPLRTLGALRAEAEYIWALREATFAIPQGQALGVIGRNGAGKSTLLKILSRITEPTEGEALVRGRLASLLEVGTGFHPEMTGRENVFLSGAILGMKRADIRRRLDEIVAFAEVERFVNTPVKHYSSGMYLRLAFAVAAHLEPDILLVDEVLAVGDMQFQKKCLNRMQDVGTSGRTVIFVSHNMSAITRLCTRALLVEGGRIVMDGPSEDVVQRYFSSAQGVSASRSWDVASQAPGQSGFRLRAMALREPGGDTLVVAPVTVPLELALTYDVANPGMRFRIALSFHTQGVCAFTTLQPNEVVHEGAGRYEARVTIPPHLLSESEYTVNVSVFSSRGSKMHFCQVAEAIAFQATDPLSGDSARGDYSEGLAGVLRPRLGWHRDYLGSADERAPNVVPIGTAPAAPATD